MLDPGVIRAADGDIERGFLDFLGDDLSMVPVILVDMKVVMKIGHIRSVRQIHLTARVCVRVRIYIIFKVFYSLIQPPTAKIPS